MFSRGFSDFENDPFFNFGSSPFKDHPFFGPSHERLRHLPRLQEAEGKHHGRRVSDALVPRHEDRDDRHRGGERRRSEDALAMPGFSSFGQHFNSIFDGMNRMMEGMTRQMQEMHTAAASEDFDGHMFSHSSVYSYSNDGKEEPRVYHAMSETRAGPGGVRETRKALRDSRTREDKMAVGRHIGQRGHTIERRRNGATGERQEDHHYLGIDESEGGQFDTEWQSRADAIASGYRRGEGRRLEGRRQEDRRQHRQERRAIADSARHKL